MRNEPSVGSDQSISGTDGQAGLLTLVADPGDSRVLREWIDEQPGFELRESETALETGEFDCCLLDLEGLKANEAALKAHKEVAEVPLPVILLVPEEEISRTRTELKSSHPEQWALVDGLLRTPMTAAELETQVGLLLRLRRQGIENRRQEEQLRRIRDEHAGHGVIITDREGSIEYVNRAFETQSGYDFEAVRGKNPRLLKSGEQDEAFYAELWETITGGAVWRGEVVNEGRDGKRYVLDQTIAPIVGPAGEIDQYVAINHEITELKELEDRLREQREQLALLNRVLRHDVRNDMAVIAGWVTTIDSGGDETTEEIIARIVSACSHVTELTVSARDLVDSITADTDPELEPVVLESVIEAEVKKRQERFDQATIEFESADGGQMVLANEMVASVFRNLINNAVQHHDSADPHVWVRVESTESTITVTIEDDGPGIPPAIRDDLFEAETKGLESAGTGMGLYLVSKLLDIYGADVRVEENEPRGTRFVLTFPVAKPIERGSR